MHSKLWWAFILSAVLFVGCASVPNSITEGDHGEYIHIYSGVEFPPRWESRIGDTVVSYERGNLTKYDDLGYDVSIGYHCRDNLVITATLYVYPMAYRGPDLEQEYNHVKRDIEHWNKSATLHLEEDSVLDVDGEEIISKLCLYSFGAQVSSAVVYAHKGWFVLRRLTAFIPADKDGALIEKDFDLLMEEMTTGWRVFPAKDCPITG
jgi:hypothetical protein